MIKSVQIIQYRLFLCFKTWYFSDEYDGDVNERTGGRLIVTNCSSKRTRTALACKMSAEYDHFLLSQKRCTILFINLSSTIYNVENDNDRSVNEKFRSYHL